MKIQFLCFHLIVLVVCEKRTRLLPVKRAISGKGYGKIEIESVEILKSIEVRPTLGLKNSLYVSPPIKELPIEEPATDHLQPPYAPKQKPIREFRSMLSGFSNNLDSSRQSGYGNNVAQSVPKSVASDSSTQSSTDHERVISSYEKTNSDGSLSVSETIYEAPSGYSTGRFAQKSAQSQKTQSSNQEKDYQAPDYLPPQSTPLHPILQQTPSQPTYKDYVAAAQTSSPQDQDYKAAGYLPPLNQPFQPSHEYYRAPDYLPPVNQALSGQQTHTSNQQNFYNAPGYLPPVNQPLKLQPVDQPLKLHPISNNIGYRPNTDTYSQQIHNIGSGNKNIQSEYKAAEYLPPNDYRNSFNQQQTYKAPDYLPPISNSLVSANAENGPDDHQQIFKAPDYLPPNSGFEFSDQNIKEHQQYRAPDYLPPVGHSQDFSQQAEQAYEAPGYLPPSNSFVNSNAVVQEERNIASLYKAPDYLPPISSPQNPAVRNISPVADHFEISKQEYNYATANNAGANQYNSQKTEQNEQTSQFYSAPGYLPPRGSTKNQLISSEPQQPQALISHSHSLSSAEYQSSNDNHGISQVDHDGYDYSKPQGPSFEEGKTINESPDPENVPLQQNYQTPVNYENPPVAPSYENNVQTIKIIREGQNGQEQSVKTLRIITDNTSINSGSNIQTIRLISEHLNQPTIQSTSVEQPSTSPAYARPSPHLKPQVAPSQSNVLNTPQNNGYLPPQPLAAQPLPFPLTQIQPVTSTLLSPSSQSLAPPSFVQKPQTPIRRPLPSIQRQPATQLSQLRSSGYSAPLRVLQIIGNGNQNDDSALYASVAAHLPKNINTIQVIHEQRANRNRYGENPSSGYAYARERLVRFYKRRRV